MDEISVEDECSPGSSNRHGDEESVDNEDVHPWPYLKELFLCLGSRNDSWRFQCCLCLPRKTELLAFKNSPSNLKKHVQRKHNSHLEKYLSLTATKRKMMKHSDEESTSKQLKLQESVKMAHKSVDQSIINFVVLGSHPFGIVDQPGFRSMIQDLKPNHTVMSRTALRTRLEKITIRMKTNVIKAMQKVKYIATTTDCWTAYQRSFIGVTAHWIDPEELNRCSVALACRRLTGSHTFDVLASTLHDIHTDYNIREKIVRTTTDNASNFIKAFRVYSYDENGTTDPSEGSDDEDDEVKEVQAIEVASVMNEGHDCSEYQLPKHHRCACHLLNLISTVDAKKADSSDSYKKVSRAAFAKCWGFWNKKGRSTQAAEVIEKECQLQLIRPNDTRWNSLFMAVERILRIVKERGEGSLRAVSAALKVPMFNPIELSFLTEYVAVMAPVAKALNILQTEADVHMGWLVPTITVLTQKLERLQLSSKLCQPLINALKAGIEQRFSEMLADPEMIAAAILLPKFRTSWTSNEDVLKAGLDYIKIHLDQVPTQRFGNSSPSSDDEDFFGSMKAHIQESTKQLDAYLTSTSTAFDILKSFPIVCSLSLELNTPLPASAACERLFSTAGLIFSPKRARLHSKNFENQLLLKLNHKYW